MSEEKKDKLTIIKDGTERKQMSGEISDYMATTKDDADLLLYECQKIKENGKKCGNIHFRHAGYVEVITPWLKAGSKDSKISTHSMQVLVCTKCKTCWILTGDKAIDVTDKIDLKAWKKAEKKLQKATGPGGEC